MAGHFIFSPSLTPGSLSRIDGGVDSVELLALGGVSAWTHEHNDERSVGLSLPVNKITSAGQALAVAQTDSHTNTLAMTVLTPPLARHRWCLN